MRRRRWPWLALLAAVALFGGSWAAYWHDLRQVEQRLARDSQVTATSLGQVEFTTWGAGPAVLVVHGAGGGFDQGRLVAQAFGGDGLRWIAPSRFGYLRSSLPADASTAAQADAFAELLDTLKIQRVAILAISGGVPPSLQFARRHPARTAALVLLSSAPYTPLKAEAQQLPVPAWVYALLFSTDLPYWVLQKLAPARLETLFDVTPAARSRLSAEDRAWVAQMVDAFQPVSRRLAGVRNEGAAIDPAARYALDQITAPTLVIHARDDGINPFAFGEFTARHLPGAEFMPLDNGGHLLLGHQADVRARVNAFLRRHAGDLSP
jgi:pimeloyl-ACP methyl ester carboxylesterase